MSDYPYRLGGIMQIPASLSSQMRDLGRGLAQTTLQAETTGFPAVLENVFLYGSILPHWPKRDCAWETMSVPTASAPTAISNRAGPTNWGPAMMGSFMHYTTFATDYDGTIAHDGVVDPPTIAAMERLRVSGCKMLLVTGRELEDLQRCMPRMDLFDLVVAENGALLFWPASGAEHLLAPPPPEAFVARLRAMGVKPLSVGRSIVGTEAPNDVLARDAIRELGLDLQVIMNKSSVMVLPAGINKESGLRAGLAKLAISADETVAVGDAENDLPFLQMCGLGVAVANALPSVKAAASHVTRGARGAGVSELIESWLAGELPPRLEIAR